MIKRLLSILVLLTGVSGLAQPTQQPLRKGNTLYEDGKYDEAEVEYRKSIENSKKSNFIGQFNLGDALYKQERYEEAANEFKDVIAKCEDREIQSKAYHNLGNTFVKAQDVEQGIEAYKNALKLNPGDDETRINLAKAMKLLQQQQQQQQGQNQDQKDSDQQEQKDQQQQNDQNQDQQGGQQQQENKPDPNKQQQPREGKISRQDAERLLEALSKEEQKVQQKVNKEKVKTKPLRTDKDW